MIIFIACFGYIIGTIIMHFILKKHDEFYQYKFNPLYLEMIIGGILGLLLILVFGYNVLYVIK